MYRGFEFGYRSFEGLVCFEFRVRVSFGESPAANVVLGDSVDEPPWT